jgi:hypothetical protein
VDLIGMLNDVKSHFEHGGQLAESHLPALLEVGGKIAADPFVQAAINSTLSESGKSIVVDLVSRLEALERDHAAAVAAAPAEVPAESEPPA